VHPSAQQVTGGAHLGRVDIGLREHPAAPQDSNLMGVDLIVFGFATVDGFHIQGMAQHKRDPVIGAEVGEPVPGKHTFGSHDDLLAVGRNGLEQGFGGGLHIAVQECCPGLIEDTDVHGAGVQIDPAVKRVLFGVESH
jgi:hypothetical protein